MFGESWGFKEKEEEGVGRREMEGGKRDDVQFREDRITERWKRES